MCDKYDKNYYFLSDKRILSIFIFDLNSKMYNINSF